MIDYNATTYRITDDSYSMFKTYFNLLRRIKLKKRYEAISSDLPANSLLAHIELLETLCKPEFFHPLEYNNYNGDWGVRGDWEVRGAKDNDTPISNESHILCNVVKSIGQLIKNNDLEYLFESEDSYDVLIVLLGLINMSTVTQQCTIKLKDPLYRPDLAERFIRGIYKYGLSTTRAVRAYYDSRKMNKDGLKVNTEIFVSDLFKPDDLGYGLAALIDSNYSCWLRYIYEGLEAIDGNLDAEYEPEQFSLYTTRLNAMLDTFKGIRDYYYGNGQRLNSEFIAKVIMYPCVILLQSNLESSLDKVMCVLRELLTPNTVRDFMNMHYYIVMRRRILEALIEFKPTLLTPKETIDDTIFELLDLFNTKILNQDVAKYLIKNGHVGYITDRFDEYRQDDIITLLRQNKNKELHTYAAFKYMNDADMIQYIMPAVIGGTASIYRNPAKLNSDTINGYINHCIKSKEPISHEIKSRCTPMQVIKVIKSTDVDETMILFLNRLSRQYVSDNKACTDVIGKILNKALDTNSEYLLIELCKWITHEQSVYRGLNTRFSSYKYSKIAKVLDKRGQEFINALVELMLKYSTGLYRTQYDLDMATPEYHYGCNLKRVKTIFGRGIFNILGSDIFQERVVDAPKFDEVLEAMKEYNIEMMEEMAALGLNYDTRYTINGIKDAMGKTTFDRIQAQTGIDISAN